MPQKPPSGPHTVYSGTGLPIKVVKPSDGGHSASDAKSDPPPEQGDTVPISSDLSLLMGGPKITSMSPPHTSLYMEKDVLTDTVHLTITFSECKVQLTALSDYIENCGNSYKAFNAMAQKLAQTISAIQKDHILGELSALAMQHNDTE